MVTKIDASMFDAQGKEIILDADADTSITADTDDQIDIRIAGADDFRFTANNMNVLSGSTLTIDSGATITNSGTATGFGVALANDGDNRVVTGTGSGGLNGEANLSFDGTTLAITGTVEPSGDTSAGDNAAIGYTAAEGLILTGQGSTNDITIKNDADADVLEIPTGTTNVSIAGQLISSDGSEAAPGICFSRDNGAGFFSAESASGAGSNSVNITNDNDATFGVFCFDNGRFILNDATTVNANSAGGITVQQAGYDNQILAVKSSDVAHGMTDHAETDTYGALRKFSSTGAGLAIEGYTEGTVGLCVESGYVTGNATKGSSGRAAIEMRSYLKSGTAIGNTGANQNMFMVNADGDVTGFLVDSDGDLHYDGTTSAFDEYDDALMLRTFMHEQTPDGVIKTEFDKFLKYNKKSLEESGIIGTIDPDDPDCYHADGTLSRPLICLTQLQRLEVGAIVQQRAMFETMKSVVEEMLPGFSKKLNERLEAQSLPALPV